MAHIIYRTVGMQQYVQGVKCNSERITSQYLTTTATHKVAGGYIVQVGMQQQERNQGTQGVKYNGETYHLAVPNKLRQHAK